MKKAELVKELMNRVEDLTQDRASRMINELFNILGESLQKGEGYSHDKFGTFEIVKRAARKGRNPQTGEVVNIPEKLAIKFKVSGSLKDKLN